MVQNPKKENMTLQGRCRKPQTGGPWELGDACASVLGGFGDCFELGIPGWGGEERGVNFLLISPKT